MQRYYEAMMILQKEIKIAVDILKTIDKKYFCFNWKPCSIDCKSVEVNTSVEEKSIGCNYYTELNLKQFFSAVL